MNENQKKLTDGEISDIRKIQESFQNKIYQFGQLYLQKVQAENALKFVTEQEAKLKDEWKEIQKIENEEVDKLLTKYGQGAIDLKEGIFISDK